jgi:hypothetical protein
VGEDFVEAAEDYQGGDVSTGSDCFLKLQMWAGNTAAHFDADLVEAVAKAI